METRMGKEGVEGPEDPGPVIAPDDYKRVHLNYQEDVHVCKK